jgi:hypothetical protein
MVKLTPVQRNQIMCAAQQLRMNARDLFLRQVAKALECCAQPPSSNDITQVLRIVMMATPTVDVPVSQTTGMTTRDDNEYYQDCGQRY